MGNAKKENGPGRDFNKSFFSSKADCMENRTLASCGRGFKSIHPVHFYLRGNYDISLSFVSHCLKEIKANEEKRIILFD
jgi:hypothetical protein